MVTSSSMTIDKIELVNYRNYSSSVVEFAKHLNIIIGKNAQGKTNLLEAVFLCAIGKSPRIASDKNLIKMWCEFARVKIDITKLVGSGNIEMYLFSNQNKAIKINGIGIKKIGQLFGEFNAIYFSPNELKLIKDGPDERRKFMDMDLCQFDKNYFYELTNYNKVLQQRNKLLKSGNEKTLKETISIWNEQLAISGSKIIFARLNLIEKLKKHASAVHAYLTAEEEKLEICYQGLSCGSENELKLLLLKKYDESLSKDIQLGYTTVGPHRDDIKIVSNDIDLRVFGSQGQQRTGALSLKLAELEVFKDSVGEYPVVLLDDVLSELDSVRQERLLTFVSNMQTIVTCTDFNFDIPHKLFRVSDGKVVDIMDK